MQAVHDNLLPTDSAYYRAKYPTEWFWADIRTRLAAKTATAAEKLHYLLAAQMWEQVPEPFEWAEYGPATDADDDADSNTAAEAAAKRERALAIAAEMRAEMAG